MQLHRIKLQHYTLLASFAASEVLTWLLTVATSREKNWLPAACGLDAKVRRWRTWKGAERRTEMARVGAPRFRRRDPGHRRRRVTYCACVTQWKSRDQSRHLGSSRVTWRRHRPRLAHVVRTIISQARASDAMTDQTETETNGEVGWSARARVRDWLVNREYLTISWQAAASIIAWWFRPACQFSQQRRADWIGEGGGRPELKMVTCNLLLIASHYLGHSCVDVLNVIKQ